MTPRGLRAGAGLAALVFSVGACGEAGTESAAEDGGIADCDELAEEVADLVVEAAGHAASTGGGLPPAALEADHPEEFDAWQLAAALADGSDRLEGRVEAARDAAGTLDCAPGSLHEVIDARVGTELQQRGEQLAEQFDREQHAAMNLMALAAAGFEPPPSSSTTELPPGFPAEFPVHPAADRVDAGRQEDGSVSATWQVDESFDVVADHYLDALQEGRFGGWDVGSTQGSETQGAEGASTGEQRLEITGYGFTGEVTITGDAPGSVTIVATLRQQE